MSLDSMWGPLIGALGGAVGLEIVRRLARHMDVRFDDARQIRHEQQHRIRELETEVRRLNDATDLLQERVSVLAAENARLLARQERQS